MLVCSTVKSRSCVLGVYGHSYRCFSVYTGMIYVFLRHFVCSVCAVFVVVLCSTVKWIFVYHMLYTTFYAVFSVVLCSTVKWNFSVVVDAMPEGRFYRYLHGFAGFNSVSCAVSIHSCIFECECFAMTHKSFYLINPRTHFYKFKYPKNTENITSKEACLYISAKCSEISVLCTMISLFKMQTLFE